MQKDELAKFSADDLLTLVDYKVMDGFSLAGRGPRKKLEDLEIFRMMAGEFIILLVGEFVINVVLF